MSFGEREDDEYSPVSASSHVAGHHELLHGRMKSLATVGAVVVGLWGLVVVLAVVTALSGVA